MKKLFIGAIALASIGAHASEVTTSVAATSDYVWRGQSQTGHNAAVQGTFEYAMKGFTLGAWTSSLNGDARGTEVDIYASYTHAFSKVTSLSVGVTNYVYTKDSNQNTMEYSLTLDCHGYGLLAAYTDDYFNADSSSMYFNLNKGFELSKKHNLGLSLALGYTTYDDEKKVGSENYLDYKVAFTRTVGKMDYEFFYTDTDRKTLSGTTSTDTKDSALGAMLTFNM
ncbi:MAG: hypothetical protein BM556_02440 [Bacteriovorax sp. MedPE-SWde]|nr:MAG: hypothetical protein BM556_02440 [Bacteriovorax sp. MedPE-SWde]